MRQGKKKGVLNPPVTGRDRDEKDCAFALSRSCPGGEKKARKEGKKKRDCTAERRRPSTSPGRGARQKRQGNNESQSVLNSTRRRRGEKIKQKKVPPPSRPASIFPARRKDVFVTHHRVNQPEGKRAEKKKKEGFPACICP